MLFLTACDQYYRYPCQDPANWENSECKNPLCEVNRDCPEYIFKGGALEQATKQPVVKMESTQSEKITPKSTTGECK
jgi:hypothetical protein